MSPLRLAGAGEVRRAERGEAGEAAAEQAGLGEERRAGVARRLRRGLAQRAVGVERVEVEAHGRLLHAMNPVAATAFVTCLRDLAGSSGAGAGRLPAICRIQAAWRASTDTTEAAAGSVLRRSRGPWPL